MRRWIARMGRLYPGAWRSRYGAEFDALLEDVPPDWKELADVLRGAVKMQLRDGAAWKWIAGLTAAGVLAAGALSFAAAPKYVSSAVVRVTTAHPGHVYALVTEVLSRGSLAQIMQRPDLNLYRAERMRLPMEQIILEMRQRDLKVEPAEGGSALRISYAGPDREKSRAVVEALVARLMQENVRVAQWRGAAWRELWKEAPPANETDRLELIEPASLPGGASNPNRLVFMEWGLAAGFAAGVLAILVRRRGRAAWRIAGWAAAGCALAAGWSFAIPNRYTSRAVLLVTDPLAPERWYATAPKLTTVERVDRMRQQILSEENLERIITGRLQLYREELRRRPLEEMAARMRRDLTIGVVADPLAREKKTQDFAISFTYPDQFVAQGVVREVILELMESNVAQMRAAAMRSGGDFRDMAERHMGENLEIIEPASYPETAGSPNRAALAGFGAAIGMALGGLWTRRRRDMVAG